MRKPGFLLQFLEKILPPDLHHLIGDLEEEFNQNINSEGLAKARFYFWSQLIRSLPWFILQFLTWNTTMFLNYLKVGWRNMKKHTGFSLINVLGLAASLSVCLLMILFIIDQKSFDRFHENSDRIVRITSDIYHSVGEGVSSYATSPASLANTLEEQYPEVEKTVRAKSQFSGSFRYSGLDIAFSGIYADPNFLDVFSFKLLQGDPNTALDEPGSVLLTPDAAEKIFGKDDPLGKVITRVGNKDYTVTGIIDESQKTHFDFEAIASYSTLTSDPDWDNHFSKWNNTLWSSYTYVLMNEGSDYDAFETKIQEQIPLQYSDVQTGASQLSALGVQPITAISLGPILSNEIGMVMPGVIAWFLIGFTIIITLIACFNYVSLTVARALNRSKEVGVRKVHGAYRASVIKQFIVESVMIALFALVFSTVLLRWLLPEFNGLYIMNLLGNQIEPSMLLQPEVLLAFIGFAVVVGILAGLYPSIYLSSFNPAQVLKGIKHTRGISGQKLKKIITVGQFTFSIIFISTSLILFQQFRHLVDTDYGFERESIVNVMLYDIPFNQLKDKLVQNPDVQSVAATSLVPASNSIYGVNVTSEYQPDIVEGHSFRIDENFIQTLGLNLVAGRNFNPEMSTDSSSAVIISTEMVKQLNFESPQQTIGETISIENEDQQSTVVGVVENFISSDPLSSNDPIALFYEPNLARFAVVKTMPGKTISFVNDLEHTWESMNSTYALKFTILDDQLKENPSLTVFIDFIKVLGLVAGFSIFISCLGLLGLAIYSSENRVKEIGIRKVLGASVNQLVFTLSKEYLWMILTAIIISIPASWFINSLWLQNVSNKADFGISIHIAGALIASALALLTISTQTLRAAKTNPVKNLRSE
ncbi:MAG TPA: ABC transporter permease [Gracilimonas sp.]|uniref:ABC transporter permease n=1 Tax=Gracilimonas sp. TaxID=1974203 RepID=UPI002DAA982A|nr:ABC transporter permease [Gracilimonas sp.]